MSDIATLVIEHSRKIVTDPDDSEVVCPQAQSFC